MIFKILIFLSLIPFNSEEQVPLDKFSNLVGKTWIADGNWGDGTRFYQEMTYEYALEQELIITKSRGYIDFHQSQIGERNHGIRKYNKESNIYEFWEFDVFGGTTKGEIQFKENDIIYIYEYQGTTIADIWTYIDSKTYKFTVGSWKDSQIQQTYLETEFKLKEN